MIGQRQSRDLCLLPLIGQSPAPRGTYRLEAPLPPALAGQDYALGHVLVYVEPLPHFAPILGYLLLEGAEALLHCLPRLSAQVVLHLLQHIGQHVRVFAGEKKIRDCVCRQQCCGSGTFIPIRGSGLYRKEQREEIN